MPKSPPLYCTRTADTGSGVQYNSGHEKKIIPARPSGKQLSHFAYPGRGVGGNYCLS